jgi:hypothetical protein
LQEIIFPFPFSSLENDVIGTLVYGIANYQEEEKRKKSQNIYKTYNYISLNFFNNIFDTVEM